MIGLAGVLIGWGAMEVVKSGRLDRALLGLRAWSVRRRTHAATANTLIEIASYHDWLDTLPVRGGE